jgi:hypothetical protein
MKTFNYSSITLNKLEEIFTIEKNYNKDEFSHWFEKIYELTKEDKIFLKKLIDRHIGIINYYTELELVSKFIAPILNRIDFTIKEKHIRDWYEVPLKYETATYSFNGRCDFVVAKGYDEPINPYFFIQEFKQASAAFPEDQLLSEMIVALKINDTNSIKGTYIIGSVWTFVILEQVSKDEYRYFISKKYDAIEFDDFQQIYQNLQYVKQELM